MIRFLFLVLFSMLCYGMIEKSYEANLRIKKLPKDFPRMIIPEGNELTKSRVELGKKLFFDKGLSIDYSISCNSCHHPKFAFADNRAISPGVEGRLGIRNAPTLTNVGFNPNFLFDGFVETLEKQSVVPIEEHAEMAFNIVEVANRLKQNVKYAALAKTAYNREMDPYVITRALGAYQRTLISHESRYDLHKKGKRKLNSSELKGKDLFFNQLHCTQCHGGFNFTNFTTQNNGLYTVYADSGRMRTTKLEEDRDLFKVPTLRNIALTAPYMHDGSMKSLEDVIRHYESGGKQHKNKSPHLKPFELSDEDRTNLILFLNTLTDDRFIKRHQLP